MNINLIYEKAKSNLFNQWNINCLIEFKKNNICFLF